jgi:hypothetical protein
LVFCFIHEYTFNKDKDLTMTTMKTKFIIFALAVLVMILGGCAKPPTAEMEQAAAAVTRAENDPDAVTYAEGSIRRARDALIRMQDEAEHKQYDAARASAAEAISAAEKAISDGKAAALQARAEAAALLSELRASVTDTEKALDTGKKAELNLDFNTLDSDFDAARRTVDQAEIAAAGNRYREAIERGQNARSALSAINTRLSQGVRAVSKKQ